MTQYIVCFTCKEEFPATTEYFHRHHAKKYGLSTRCKECTNKYNQEYYQNNKEEILKQQRKYNQTNKERMREYNKEHYQNNRMERLEYQKDYSQNNKEEKKEYDQKYYQNNKEKVKKQCNEYYQNNKEKINERLVKRMHQSPKLRLSHNITTRIWGSLKHNKHGRHWETLVDFTLKELMDHLKSLFQPDMTWDNYGLYGWHIDHIRPVSSFNFISYEDEDFKKCWDLNNLQPLWAEDNLSKGAKWGPEDE